MRFLRGLVVAAGAGVLVLVPVTTAFAQVRQADVSVSVTLPTHGPIKVKLGQTITLAFSVTNHGPSTARGVTIAAADPDAFNPVATTCGGLPPSDGVARCPDLQPGQTVHGTTTSFVCCFPVGEPRTQSAGVFVLETSTIDPNPDNDWSLVHVKLIGRHGFA